MATYDKARYADAAAAYFAKFGLVPNPSEAAEKVSDTQANAASLAKELGEAHPAWKGLDAVARLRESIGRRFIRLSVAPLVAPETPKQRAARVKAEKAAAAEATAAPATEGEPTPAATPRAPRARRPKASDEAAAASA